MPTHDENTLKTVGWKSEANHLFPNYHYKPVDQYGLVQHRQED